MTSAAQGGAPAQAGSSPPKARRGRSPFHPLPAQQTPPAGGRAERKGTGGHTGHWDAMEHLWDQHLPKCALFPRKDLAKGDAIPYFRGMRCSASGMGSRAGTRPSRTPIAQTQPSCSTPSASTAQLTCPLADKKNHCSRSRPARGHIQLCHGALPARVKPSRAPRRGLAAQRARLAKRRTQVVLLLLKRQPSAPLSTRSSRRRELCPGLSRITACCRETRREGKGRAQK